MEIFALQIGSHIGKTINDFVFNAQFEKKNLLLIEPVSFYFEQLKENYLREKRNNNIIFGNYAVSNIDGFLTLYTPSQKNNFDTNPKTWLNQITSVNKSHLISCDENVIIEELQVPCKRMNTIIKEYGIKKIEFLIIDTEGHEYEILMDFDLSLVKPDHIIFENCHMDGFLSKGRRYNELMSHLRRNGYFLYEENNEDTHMKLGTI